MQFNGLCWICGAKADSREHRYKKSDLLLAFGKPPYTDESRPVIIKNGEEYEIRGPNSNLVKFQSVLCSQCNNVLSQPYDIAYEVFIGSFLHNVVIEEGKSYILDLTQFFSKGEHETPLNLYRYFVKNFGCRLIENGISVTDSIRSFVKGETDSLENLIIKFTVDGNIYKLLNELYKKGNSTGFLSFGPLSYNLLEDGNEIQYAVSYMKNHWFTANFLYSKNLTYKQVPWLEKYYNSDRIPLATISGIDDELNLSEFNQEAFKESAGQQASKNIFNNKENLEDFIETMLTDPN